MTSLGEQHGPPVSAAACIDDRAIGAGVVRFGAERRGPCVPIPATRAPARRGGIAEFVRSLDDVSVALRSSHCATSNDVESELEVDASVGLLAETLQARSCS
jgi:hypothetical protein